MTGPGDERPAGAPVAAVALRAALLGSLLALLLIGPVYRARGPATLDLEGTAADTRALAEAIVARDPPSSVLRPAERAPTERELDLITAVAARAPVFVELPGPEASLRLDPPATPRAGRAAALAFEGWGIVGGDVVVRLLGPGDVVLDSVRARPGAGGRVRGAFRVRPERPGWTEWRAAAGPVRAGAGAWVAPVDPPRVLVVSGPPSWESRAVLRALERAGVELAAVQMLGRGNVVTTGGAATRWWDPAALARHDVVLLLPGAAPIPAALESLADHVADGHGALLAGGAGLQELGVASGTGPARLLDPASLVWSAPPELAPLPGGGDGAGRAVALRGASPVAAVAARTTEGDTLLLVTPFGRGRAAGLGIRETWRWTLVAGQEARHREFWRSLVDWLAAPSADAGVRVAPVTAAVPATVAVRRWQPPTGPTEELALRRPDGSVGAVSGPAARFVAVDTGVHEIELAGRPRAGFRAVGADVATPAALGRARLALVAAASGGGALEPDAFRARSSPFRTPAGRDGRAWLGLIFGTLVAMAIAEWAMRRFRGLP